MKKRKLILELTDDRNALERVPDGAIVSIHDGVRPFASPEMLRRMFSQMEEARALVPVVPVVDTLRSTDPSVPDPDRSVTVAVQTPQIFKKVQLQRRLLISKVHIYLIL